MTTFRTTLRRLATEQDEQERVRLSDMLAIELETTFNRQSNQAQLAISDAEEHAWQRMDRLNAQLGDTNTLLNTMIAQYADLLSMVRDGAARQKKSEARLDAHDARITAIEAIIDARPTLREQERKALVDEILVLLGVTSRGDSQR